MYDLYDKNGFPEIFESDTLDPQLHEGLQDVFQQLKTGQMDSINDYFGSMVHDIKAFKSFVPGNVYSIRITSYNVCYTKLLR